MLNIQIDEETFEQVMVEHLKNTAFASLEDAKYLRHPQDAEFHSKLLPALLTVISYFSTANDYRKFTAELFTKTEEEVDDDFQFSFHFEDEE
jgi:hypothetical protein